MKSITISRGKILAALFVTLTACSDEPRNTNGKDECSSHPVAVQTLGSGGPIADDHRAGSSNTVWLDGKARLLIDAGAGVFARYAEAGIDFRDHSAVLLTHLHGDHAAGIPSLLNLGSFSRRKEGLSVFGPTGNNLFPSTTEFFDALIGKESGAFRYLHPYLEQSEALPPIRISEVDVSQSGMQTLMDSSDFFVGAIGVHHLDVPSLSYVIKAKGKTIVFAGDQSFLSEDFVTTLRNSDPDLLVMHNAISMSDGQPRGLHRDPESIGATAAALGAKTLLLTHHMQRAIKVQNEVNDAIAVNYSGPVLLADDLSCFPL
ncbi:MAG: MBL fold metallo-hydrolase [Pseudomonadota bacterium]